MSRGDTHTYQGFEKEPACLINLWRVLTGFQQLLATLKKLGFMHLKSKHCNQDPIDNFSGLKRDNRIQSNNPTFYQFTGHSKALVINSLTYYNTLGTKCGDYAGASLLTWQNYLEIVDKSDESGEHIRWPERTRQNPSRDLKILG